MTRAQPLPRVRLRARGVVQGVGFRPHVWRLARAERLSGFALNDSEGVLIEVQGSSAGRFAALLAASPPPLARIEALEAQPIAPVARERGFEIRTSQTLGACVTGVAADTAPCEACLSDMFDPRGRRWRHAFISCTDCGPRFTITRALPYDRPQTSMAGFPLCAACADEYGDPGDRRFHAEPIACPDCGPVLSAPVSRALEVLRGHGVVALKGVGGFQLLCDARAPLAVSLLRRRKARGAKPFAVMVANVASAMALCELSADEVRALEGPDRPVVLARRRPGADLADAVAPGLDLVGVMLPSTPLHWLVFHEAAGRPAGTGWTHEPQPLALVATSANPRGEPLLTDAGPDGAGLAGLADLVIDHDRPIVCRADDPVVRVVDGLARTLRRGRGQAPGMLRLGFEAAPVLALGGHLKAAVCLTRGREALLSQHVGDLDDPATIAFHAQTAAHLEALLDTRPVALACDLHPDFASTALAHARGLPVIGVQHHHAHAAGVLAEAGHAGSALAIVLDGYGLGDDGGAWGGEILRVDGPRFARLGGLASIPLPGGDRAAREPWRMAAAVLHALGRGGEIEDRFGGHAQARPLARLLAGGAPVPATSSAGRWFDAAAALLDLCAVQRFEAEAAMRLEAAAGRHGRADPMPLPLDPSGRLDLLPLMAALAAAPSIEAGAALFHDTLAEGLCRIVADQAEMHGLSAVALAGGCLANRRLAEALCTGLRRRGLTPLMNRAAPPGDGGLAFGQAVVAALTFAETGKEAV